MVFAWSFTEVIRYSHYATGLLNLKIGFLEWARFVLSLLPSSLSLSLSSFRWTRCYEMKIKVFYFLRPLSYRSWIRSYFNLVIGRVIFTSLSLSFLDWNVSIYLNRLAGKAYGPLGDYATKALVMVWPPGNKLPFPSPLLRSIPFTNTPPFRPTPNSSSNNDASYACSTF